MKKTLLLLLALVSTVALAAFELGKVDAIIYHSKKGTEAAKTLALYLNKVYGKKYTLKAAKAAGSAAGIYVGLPAPGVKNPAADDREYCVLHVDDSKLFLYGNAKYKCDMFAVSALRLNSGRSPNVLLPGGVSPPEFLRSSAKLSSLFRALCNAMCFCSFVVVDFVLMNLFFFRKK